MLMKKTTLIFGAAALLLASCGGKKGADGPYPANFDKIGDAGRVAFMMNKVQADSLARFIIYSSLGKNPGAKIDTLAIATNYAYERLKGDALDKFSAAYDACVEALPLGEKMKVYMFAGTEDPQGLGYKLGLEYMSSIRNGHKKAADVERELTEFKKACGSDTATYRRFIIGFQTVLKMDHGKDVPEEIYRKFVNFE